MLKRKRLTKPPAQTAAAFEALEDRSLMDAGLNALFAQLHLGQGPDGQIVRQLDSLFVTEGSDADGFGLALKEQPSERVVVTIPPVPGLEITAPFAPSDQFPSSPYLCVDLAPPEEGYCFSYADYSLIFTPENWDQPRTITVEAVDDRTDKGDRQRQIRLAVESADPNYQNLAVPPVVVNVADDDGLESVSDGFDRSDSSDLNVGVAIAIADLAHRLAVEPTEISTVLVREEFGNLASCYRAEVCLAIAVSQTLILLEHDGEQYVYRDFGNELILFEFQGRDWTIDLASWQEQAGELWIADTQLIVTGAETGLATTAIPARNVAVEANVRISEGEHAGVVARYQPNGDMYLGALAHTSEGFSAQIWKHVTFIALVGEQVSSQWTNLSFKALPGVSVGGNTLLVTEPNRLRLEVIGSSLKLFLDGNLVGEAFDTDISGIGATGVRGSAGAAFDDFFAEVDARPSLPYSDPFPEQTGESPHGFDQIVGPWEVRNGLLGPDTQIEASLVALPGYSAADGVVEVDVDVVGVDHHHAGLVARHSGPGDQNMYLGALVSQGGANFAEIWRNVDGEWTQLASAPVPASAGRLRFILTGPRLQLFFNGALAATAHDSSLWAPGRFGLRSSPHPDFDNFKLLGIDATPLDFGDLIPTVGEFEPTEDGYLRGAPSAQGVNLAVGEFFADVAVEANVRVDQPGHAGLVARYVCCAGGGMYLGALSNRGGQFFGEIWRESFGIWTRLSSELIGSNTGRLRFEVIGQSLTLLLDGQIVTRTFDDTIAEPGRVGIRGSAGSQFRLA